ncbi:MAG: helix-turn-helix transcriptional regulator [Pseudomonadota bacterium]
MQDKVITRGADQPHPIDIHVGSRLRERRMLLSVPQDQLAKQTGITFQQIQKYESGRNRVSASRLYEFSRILDVPIAYFFSGFRQLTGLTPDENVAYGLSDQAQENFGGFERTASANAFTPGSWTTERDTLDLVRAFQSIKNPKMQKEFLRFAKQMAASLSAPADDNKGDE